MKYKKLLAIILLSLSFCFVSGAGWGYSENISTSSIRSSGLDGVGLEKDSVSPAPGWSKSLEAALRRRRFERYTLLVIPISQVSQKKEMFSVLWNLLSIYPNAEIPEEFTWILPPGANDVSEIKKEKYYRIETSVLAVVSKDLMLSLLLTMAYQQGYEIEHVTSNYVILVKSVYAPELKEWKDRMIE